MTSKSSHARDYRIVRGCFAFGFVALCAWLAFRTQLSGWSLLVLVLSAVSAVINAAQAIAGPSAVADEEGED